ncbi:MAG: secondary thiamine-phosphate synthase enzyme YjbQ [Actinobacteria bacterium]|nr:secondary thiamine-phosphate synthase enzyme YjbQ [Actinomycetota bacterium]
MRSEVLSIDTVQAHFVDLTSEVRSFSRGEGDGLVNVFVPHATAGVALIETGSGTEQDLEATVNRLLPRDDRYVHRHGSVGHGADHVVPAFIAPSLSIPVVAGELTLGTWQSIVLVDLNEDNPQRHVRLSFVPA